MYNLEKLRLMSHYTIIEGVQFYPLPEKLKFVNNPVENVPEKWIYKAQDLFFEGGLLPGINRIQTTKLIRN